MWPFFAPCPDFMGAMAPPPPPPPPRPPPCPPSSYTPGSGMFLILEDLIQAPGIHRPSLPLPSPNSISLVFESPMLL